ncbi:MAG: hypothetical protein HY696_00865 [Deltaproteobacteria bacterium]|nr:hypothetical protein [Deltaproteobacteria bacterium]
MHVWRFIGVLLLLMAPLTAAHATMVAPASLADLTTEAGVIFIGTCQVRETSLKPTPIGGVIPVSHYTFEVQEVLKGEIADGSDFQFDQVGGPIPVGTSTADLLRPLSSTVYDVGQTYLLFLKPLSTGWWTPVGLMQGRFTVTVQPDGSKTVTNGINNQLLFQGMHNAASPAVAVSKAAQRVVEQGAGPDLSYDVLKELVKGLQPTP